MHFVIPGLTRNPVLSWIPASLENNFQIPPNPPLLKGGEGGFSSIRGCHAPKRGMENFAGMTRSVVNNDAVYNHGGHSSGDLYIEFLTQLNKCITIPCKRFRSPDFIGLKSVPDIVAGFHRW